jgi:hypothetical protein
VDIEKVSYQYDSNLELTGKQRRNDMNLDYETVEFLNGIRDQIGKNHIEVVQRLSVLETTSKSIETQAIKTNGRVTDIENETIPFVLEKISTIETESIPNINELMSESRGTVRGFLVFAGVLVTLIGTIFWLAIAQIGKNTEKVIKLEQMHQTP